MTPPTLYLLDTNIFIHLARGGAMALYLQAKYNLNTILADALISIVTVGEVRSFAKQRNWGKQKLDKLDQLVAKFVPVDINDDRVLSAYAEIDVASHGLGQDMGKNDLWIAATAKTLGIPLMTTDKDFDHLNGTLLTVIWIDPALGKPQ